MKLLRRCYAPGVAVCLICRKPALLLGRLLVALPGAGFIAGAIVVCWGCPGRAMRDSSSGVERLRIPRGRKSKSAVVLMACSTYDPSIIMSTARESTSSRRGPCGDIYPRVHVWAFSRSLPRPLQGGVRSSELLTASLHLGTALGELPLRWLAGEFFIAQRPLGDRT
ncbi:hypothetical protein CDL15_Pgr021092 [Punica granatum]|uniref:Uncharacterized protein n=1 Tax=Punica granatum TaxID=22663 RepID=A0A218XK53_PUNGR|nr:hypothetical protein CDL15_Pgr021092 [Punica granatum]